MAQFVVANNVNTQLAAALPASGAGSTTATLASSANLPTLNTSIGQMMPLTLNDAATGAVYETVYVTAISGPTLTILRAQEGTGALNWSVGDFAFCGPTAGTSGLTTMRTQYQESASYSSSQTLTAAMAGESIGFTGSSASTFSLPGQSTVPALTPTAVYNDGTAALTLTAAGSDKLVVASGQLTSIVMQPGDDLSFYASATPGLWQAASGSALRQFEPLVVAPATQPNQAVQFGQLVGVVGQAVNLKCIQTTAGTSLTYTADQIIAATALNGLPYLLPSFNQTLNGSTTGIGGLDTGALAANSFYAIYAAYNPTTGTQGIFAQLEPSGGATTVYGGAHQPAGYTVTALIGVWPTNASSQFIVASQYGRTLNFVSSGAYTGSGSVNLAAINLAALVPKSAKFASGNVSITVSSAGTSAFDVFDQTLTDASVILISVNTGSTSSGGNSNNFSRFPILTPQTWWVTSTQSATISNMNVSLIGFEF